MLSATDFEKFDCKEYLNEEYREGYYDEPSYLQLILKHDDAYLDGKAAHLVIGHAGCDGIQFCYRANEKGIWAFYPYEEDYDLKASTVKELIVGYCDASISL